MNADLEVVTGDYFTTFKTPLLRGRVFTVLMSSNYAVLGLGMVLAGPLTNEFGARWVWGVSACLSALAALVGYGLARGIRSPVIEARRVAEAEV